MSDVIAGEVVVVDVFMGWSSLRVLDKIERFIVLFVYNHSITIMHEDE